MKASKRCQYARDKLREAGRAREVAGLPKRGPRKDLQLTLSVTVQPEFLYNSGPAAQG